MARKKKEKAPVIWACADCESDSFDGQSVNAFIWGVYTSEGDYSAFWSTEDFVDYIRNSGINILYAHNGGKFDWMMPEILSQFEDGKIMLINGRIAKAKIGNCELRDSYLCLPAPLAKFGEKDDFDYSMLERGKSAKRRTEYKQAIEKYLMQDCKALFNAMSRFIELYGFALTQAGASMKTWEAMGGEPRRYGVKHDQAFREFYYGGRCQAVEYCDGVDGDFKLYDINSSYPFAMTENHPCGQDYYISTDFKGCKIGASFWKIYGVSRGALPVKTKYGTGFPVDHIPTYYNCTGWEMLAGIETGTLDIIGATGYIPRRLETMKPYVEKFYAERQEAKRNKDQIGDVLAKIFMNSLYGKYGSNPDEYMEYKIAPAGTKRDKDWMPHIQADEYDIIQRPAPQKTYYDVALAASVTGLARANLWRAMCASKRVMYCDTDSILCEMFTGATGDKLGEWKLEAEIKKVWIAGKKCYAFELEDGSYKTAHKGVSKMDIEIEDIKRAAAGEVIMIKKSAPTMKLDGRQEFTNRRIRRT